MSKFRSKSGALVDAFRWMGGHDHTEDPAWIVQAIKSGAVEIVIEGVDAQMMIHSPNKVVTAELGDWIIRRPNGAIWRCNPVDFAKNYAPVPR